MLFKRMVEKNAALLHAICAEGYSKVVICRAMAWAMRPLFLIPLLLLPLLLLLGCGQAEEASVDQRKLTPVRFMADWLAVPEQGGFFQALAKGYYEEAGLDVEIVHRTGNTVQTMVVSRGAADISIGGSDEVLLAIGQGMPVQIVGSFFQNHPYCLMFHQGKKVDSFADLDGRKVMTFLGATWIPFVEKKYGIEMDLIPLEASIQRFMADASGNFIQAVFVTNEPLVAQREGVATESLLISESLQGHLLESSVYRRATGGGCCICYSFFAGVGGLYEWRSDAG
jgi:ABC-type nitrate/sulfonate/bicarbonate transport system substrate-binding protein